MDPRKTVRDSSPASPSTVQIKSMSIAVILATASTAGLADSYFFDDFNRSDGSVGNGWFPSSLNTFGDLVLQSGALSAPGPDGYAEIYRPIPFESPVTFSGTLTDGNGFGGLRQQFDLGIYVGGYDTRFSGYNLQIWRSDSTQPSFVQAIYNGKVIGTLTSTFKFTSEIAPTVTFDPAGRIFGSIKGGSGSFGFSFDMPKATFSDSRLRIGIAYPDHRSPVITSQTLDNVAIKYSQTPRLFTLGIGLSDSVVAGGKDAAKVLETIRSVHTAALAGPERGNSTAPILLDLSSTDGREKIANALKAMEVRKGDTLIFYYSGHGEPKATVHGVASNDEASVNATFPATDTLPVRTVASTSDETVQLGLRDSSGHASDQYISDDELTKLFQDDPKWVGVNKVFIFDACYAGGFWGSGATSDFGDLNKLDHAFFLSAAPETEIAHTYSGGLGLWTWEALLPSLLSGNLTGDELLANMQGSIDTWNSLYAGLVTGIKSEDFNQNAELMARIRLFAAHSADWDMTKPLAPVPEPETYALFLAGLGMLGVAARRKAKLN